jgi:DNA replication protein DnaC
LEAIGRVQHPETYTQEEKTLALNYPKALNIFNRHAQEFAKRESNDEVYHYKKYKGLNLEHASVVEGLVYYFLGEKEEAKKRGLDIRKGIRITGNTGSGKTMLFRIWQATKIGHKFGIKSVLEIVDQFNLNGDAITQYTTNAVKVTVDGKKPTLNHLMIDDLGKESLGGHFSKKDRNVIGEIIDTRYLLWTKHGLLTHFTDNLLNKEVEAMYGDRISGRLFQMTNHVLLGAKSDSVDFRRV